MNPGMPRQPEPEPMDLPAEADAYARADFDDVNTLFVQRLLEFVGPVDQVRAVDLGTGPGRIAVDILRNRPRWRVTALDLSAAMLHHARMAVDHAHLISSVTLLLADAKQAPLVSDAFDVVFSNSLLHHVNASNQLWNEVQRIARPGAAVFLRDLARPDGDTATRRIVDHYAHQESNLLRTEFYRPLKAAYTPAEVRAQLDRAGLHALQVAMVSDRHFDVFERLPTCRASSPTTHEPGSAA